MKPALWDYQVSAWVETGVTWVRGVTSATAAPHLCCAGSEYNLLWKMDQHQFQSQLYVQLLRTIIAKIDIIILIFTLSDRIIC